MAGPVAEEAGRHQDPDVAGAVLLRPPDQLGADKALVTAPGIVPPAAAAGGRGPPAIAEAIVARPAGQRGVLVQLHRGGRAGHARAVD